MPDFFRSTNWLVTLALCVTWTAHAEPKAGPTSTYQAFGDSIAFGLDPTEVPPYARLNLHRFKGYPEFVAGSLDLKLANASRVAETTKSFLTGLESDRLPYPLWNPSYPNFVEYSPNQNSQADYALDALLTGQTKLVTLSIGANDLGVLFMGCGGVPECIIGGLPGTLGLVAQNLSAILERIRVDAGYTGPIVVVNYYAFNYDNPQEVLVFSALNNVIAEVTGLYQGKVADGFSAFQKASAREGGNACAARLLVPLGNGTCDTHPSIHGQKLLANAVLAALAN